MFSGGELVGGRGGHSSLLHLQPRKPNLTFAYGDHFLVRRDLPDFLDFFVLPSPPPFVMVKTFFPSRKMIEEQFSIIF